MKRSQRRWRVLALALLSGVLAIAGCKRDADSRATRTEGSAERGAAAPGAVLRNDSLGVEDRCVVCHSGVLDPRHKLDAQPITAHPGRLLDIHAPLRFGCTPCHGGNGRTTVAAEAHAGGARAGGFLTGDATEIACGRCHVNEVELDGAPHLSHGRALVRQGQCDGCHMMGESGRTAPPGPDLAGIARRTNPTWLFRWIKNPRDYADNARMPRFQLEDRYVDALVGYLQTFRDGAAFDTSGFPAGDAEQGKKLVAMSFCVSCHTIEGRGGKDAIDLARVGNKLSRAWVLRLLSDTHAAAPWSPMPQYRFTREQVANIAAYVREDLTDPSFAAPEADSALGRLGTYWPDSTQRVDVGRRLFKELRCGNCHAFPGGEDWIRVSPVLSRLEEREISELPWGSTKLPQTLADYVWHKVRSPRVYETVPHRYKMPSYDFTPEEARDVAIAVLAQADRRKIPEAFVCRDSSDAVLSLPGEFGRLVRNYRCLSCHAVRGIGHNISYDLGVEGSRAQHDWIYRYLKLPYTIRPALTVRMPIFNLTDQEAGILADGISGLFRDAAIDSVSPVAMGASEVAAGRELFERSGCKSCHQMGPTGGYVGPAFTGSTPLSRTLQPGWIVRWLEDPQHFDREVLEPRYGFSERQARQLTAYLMSIGEEKERAAR